MNWYVEKIPNIHTGLLIQTSPAIFKVYMVIQNRRLKIILDTSEQYTLHTRVHSQLKFCL